jgi:pyruvate formate lyase activating enzyme
VGSDVDARFWIAEKDRRVRCGLCPRRCLIAPGRSGTCLARENRDGRLVSLVYGRPSAVHVDPIEKKPLYHFLPGTDVLSIGTAGCNLACAFCQNWSLSRCGVDELPARSLPPRDVVAAAVAAGCPSIAFTYNEPTIFAEYAIDTAALARETGLKTVMVTNGYVTQEALPDVYRDIDAANVDLKAFDEGFYRTWTRAELKPVLDTLVALVSRGVWVEVTTLLIPGLNDDDASIRAGSLWIRDNLGADVPLHFSAFHPDYRMLDRPPTPPEVLRRARRTALDAGLRWVYEGNVVSEGGSTWCPSCGRLLIRRSGNAVTEVRLEPGDRCACGERVPLRR